MPETTLSIDLRTSTSGKSSETTAADPRGWLRLVIFNALIFAVTLAAGLFHALAEPNTRITFFGDSSLYLKGTQLIVSTVSAHGLSGLLHASVVETLTFDGTLLPLFFASLCGLARQNPDFANWSFFVMVQSFLHAVSACLVLNLARAATRNTSLSVLTALCWGLYPAALVANTRYLTETITLTVALALANALAIDDKRRYLKLLAGLLLGVLVINKPGLAVGAFLATIVALIYSRRDWWRIVLPAAAVIAAWWFYTGLSGRHYFSLARKPIGNAVTGWDFEMEAMMNFPGAPILTLFNDDDSPLGVFIAQWWNHPFDSLHLACVKMQRIWAVPWNDFRHQVLGLDAASQVIVHQALLYGALFGLAVICIFACKRRAPARAAAVCLAILSGHLAYVLFEAIPRYAFTAMPFVIVIAAVGITSLRMLTWKARMTAASIALVLFLAVTHFEDIFPLHDTKETAHPLSSSVGYIQKIKLPERLAQDENAISDALLLIDASDTFDPSICVNGHLLNAPCLPLFYFSSSTYNYFNIWRELAYLLNKTPDALRQWRAVPVPLAYLKPGELNEVQIAQKHTAGGAQIYSDPTSTGRKILTWTGFHPSRIYHQVNTDDLRIPSVIPAARLSSTSWVVENGTVSPLSTRHLRVHLLLAFDRKNLGGYGANLAVKRNGDEIAQEAGKTIAFKAADFDPVLRDPKVDQVGISGPLLKAVRTNAATGGAHFSTGCAFARFTLTGQARSIGKSASVGIWVMAKGKNGYGIIPARLPLKITATPEWQTFKHSDFIALGCLNGNVDTVELALYPGPWYEVATYGVGKQSGAAFLKDLKVELTGVDLPDISGKAVVAY